VRNLNNRIRRKVAQVRERFNRYKQQRARTKKRRQRIVDWEKSNEREPARKVSCAFCDSARSWLIGQWNRLGHAAKIMSQGIARLVDRIVRGWSGEKPAEPGAETKRIFHRHSYPGSRTRRFELHLPRGYREGSATPVLMVLHGCRQDNADIRRISNFGAIADREGFIVVYPFVTGYSGLRIRNCWGWWIENEIRPGAGEVEDLWQIVEQVKEEVSIDDRRIHVAGLSSGGGMAVAAMVAHAGKIASGAAVAGVPYSETARAVAYGAPNGVAFKPVEHVVSSMKSVLGEQGRPSPIFIIHSNDDPIVDIQAARNIRDSWAACFGIDSTRPVSKSSGTTEGAPWVHAE